MIVSHSLISHLHDFQYSTALHDLDVESTADSSEHHPSRSDQRYRDNTVEDHYDYDDEEDDNASTLALLESPITASRAHQIHTLMIQLRSASYAARHDPENEEHVRTMERLRRKIKDLVDGHGHTRRRPCDDLELERNPERAYALRIPPPPMPRPSLDLDMMGDQHHLHLHLHQQQHLEQPPPPYTDVIISGDSERPSPRYQS